GTRALAPRPRGLPVTPLHRRRPDLLAHGVFLLATCITVAVIFLATGLPPLWMVLFSAALGCGFVFLALPEKKLVLWTAYLLIMPLGAAKWVTLEPTFFFGENPDGFVMYVSDVPLFVLLLWWAAEVALGKGRVV